MTGWEGEWVGGCGERCYEQKGSTVQMFYLCRTVVQLWPLLLQEKLDLEGSLEEAVRGFLVGRGSSLDPLTQPVPSHHPACVCVCVCVCVSVCLCVGVRSSLGLSSRPPSSTHLSSLQWVYV